MSEMKRDVQDSSGVKKKPTSESQPPEEAHRARTEGTDRDFDESGESENQAHGHPRGEPRSQVERGREDQAEGKRQRGLPGGHEGQGRRPQQQERD